MDTPVFKDSYAVDIADDTHVVISSERGSRLLTGSAYVAVARGLASSRSVREIIGGAPTGVSAAEIFFALDRLKVLGLVRDNHVDAPISIRAFWDALDVDPASARRKLQSTRVTVAGLGDATTGHVAAALGALGISVDGGGDFAVVVTDDYLRPELAALNETFLASKRPWIMARLAGSIVWLGPFFQPGAAACWECLAERMRGLRPVESFLQKRRHDSYPRLPANYALPSTETAAAGLLATETAKCIVEAPGRLDAVLVTVDLATLETQRHPVVKRPQCPACGDAAAFRDRPPEPLQLVSRRKGFTADGGHRVASPEETLAKYATHVSPITGVVRQLTPSAKLDAAITPVFISGPNASTVEDTLGSLRGHFRDSNGGKGKTAVQAKASALCEAIERHCGAFQGNEFRIRGTYASLGGDSIHPSRCLLFSDAQYAARGNSHGRYSRAPEPFDETAECEWTPLWSLTERRFKSLPTAYCYYDYPLPKEQRFCWADSNGCAAGNSIEEAILQGFFELVERDAVALWWYNRVRRPAVDLASFHEPYFAQLANYYRSLRRDLWVLDITADLGIPSFVAVSGRTDSAAEDLLLGFGCHSDPAIGIQRALGEVNQFLPVVIERHSDPSAPLRVDEKEVLDWLRESTLANRPYLVPDAVPPLTASHYVNRRYDDLKDEIDACVAGCAALGLEVLVLDQTRPDIGLPVVRVVVPGLRHFWGRFAPGRLYDVPVTLGWLPAALSERELNPITVMW